MQDNPQGATAARPATPQPVRSRQARAGRIPSGEALKGHAAMLLFSALVGGSFSLGVLVANDIAPAALNSARFLIAAGLLGAVVLATKGPPRRIPPGLWRYGVLGGVFALYFVLMFEGLKTATPVSASAVFTLTPILSAGFGYLLMRQILTPRMALALAIGAGGALWVIFRGDPAALLQFQIGRGEAIYFLGCVSHALYTPLVRKLNRGEPPLVFTFGMLVAGFVVLTTWGWSDILATDWFGLGWLIWGTLLYLAVFTSAVTFVLLQYATMRLPSSKVMAYTYLAPSWVIGWEVALGHAPPPPIVLAGVVFTAIALMLLLKDGNPGTTTGRAG